MRHLLLPFSILLMGVIIVGLDRLSLLAPPNYTPKGMEAFDKGDMVNAIHDFAQAQKHCETDILARRMLGMAYHNYRWNDEALRQYESVWTLAAQNAAIAMRNAGRIHQAREEPKKALECFEKALAVDPAFAGVWADVAELQTTLGNAPAAIEAIGRALEIEPDDISLKAIRDRIQSMPKPMHPPMMPPAFQP